MASALSTHPLHEVEVEPVRFASAVCDGPEPQS
ncbi:MAG: hypothetical protein V7633_2486 [Pseudonocardia sp.]|jgi:hypothetical protein